MNERDAHERFNLPKGTSILRRLIALMAISMLLDALASSGASGSQRLQIENSPPRFEQFRVARAFRGQPARVNLRSDPFARLYRTNLREGARRGPNFSGSYTVVEWGCGTACTRFAIVDARTGRVHFPRFDSYNAYSDSMGVEYRLDSRLLIVDVEPDADESGTRKTNYYRWEGNRLVLIRTVRSAPNL